MRERARETKRESVFVKQWAEISILEHNVSGHYMYIFKSTVSAEIFFMFAHILQFSLLFQVYC